MSAAEECGDEAMVWIAEHRPRVRVDELQHESGDDRVVLGEKFGERDVGIYSSAPGQAQGHDVPFVLLRLGDRAWVGGIGPESESSCQMLSAREQRRHIMVRRLNLLEAVECAVCQHLPNFFQAQFRRAWEYAYRQQSNATAQLNSNL